MAGHRVGKFCTNDPYEQLRLSPSNFIDPEHGDPLRIAGVKAASILRRPLRPPCVLIRLSGSGWLVRRTSF